MKPLNGEKTHPLTKHALYELEKIRTRPVTWSEVNPGVANRLLREALVTDIMLPSPFKTHKGRKILDLDNTDAGVEILYAR